MVKIYYTDIFSLKDPSVFEQLYVKVNAQRRSKILRCKNKEDKYRSLAAGLLLRYALEQHGISYESAKIIIGENGKPYLEEKENFYFSISHSQDLVVCAVADKELGVDVESLIRIDKICSDISKRERFLERIAAKTEKEWFGNLPEEEKKKGFLRIWTGKESYGKANG
ncbi:MAG: 4'-phosphopantetheinyl transferase superfamily protein [Lachnospiraceae bacterium]|nr:4'-phosphopantetheinyl transferase superfamily protein [Lachnospiraceae bacterium]